MATTFIEESEDTEAVLYRSLLPDEYSLLMVYNKDDSMIFNGNLDADTRRIIWQFTSNSPTIAKYRCFYIQENNCPRL